MYCIKCGAENKNSQVVCSECGAAIGRQPDEQSREYAHVYAPDDLRGVTSASAAAAAAFALFLLPESERAVYVLGSAAVALVCGVLCLNSNFRHNAVAGIIISSVCVALCFWEW